MAEVSLRTRQVVRRIDPVDGDPDDGDQRSFDLAFTHVGCRLGMLDLISFFNAEPSVVYSKNVCRMHQRRHARPRDVAELLALGEVVPADVEAVDVGGVAEGDKDDIPVWIRPLMTPALVATGSARSMRSRRPTSTTSTR